MKSRHDDELITAAFEGAQQPSGLVQGDKQTFHELSQLRAALVDIACEKFSEPDLDVSRERLRAKILNEGLSPKQRGQSKWLWMPATVGCMALILSVLHNQTRIGDPVVKLDEPSMSGAFVPRVELSEPQGTFSDDSSNVMRLAASTPESRRTKFNGTKSRSGQGLHRNYLAMNTEKFGPPMPVQGEKGPVNSGLKVSNAASLATGSGAGGGSADDGVILLANDQDANTGSNKAKEVDAASNVVIGG